MICFCEVRNADETKNRLSACPYFSGTAGRQLFKLPADVCVAGRSGPGHVRCQRQYPVGGSAGTDQRGTGPERSVFHPVRQLDFQLSPGRLRHILLKGRSGGDPFDGAGHAHHPTGAAVPGDHGSRGRAHRRVFRPSPEQHAGLSFAGLHIYQHLYAEFLGGIAAALCGGHEAWMASGGVQPNELPAVDPASRDIGHCHGGQIRPAGSGGYFGGTASGLCGRR